MSPTAVTPSVEAPPAPPERPGFFAVAWATFLGYFVAAILLVAVGLVLMLAGVGIIDVGGTAGRGLFYRYDVWSWAAEACAAILITGLTALVVNAYLSSHTSWEVPAPPRGDKAAVHHRAQERRLRRRRRPRAAPGRLVPHAGGTARRDLGALHRAEHAA